MKVLQIERSLSAALIICIRIAKPSAPAGMMRNPGVAAVLACRSR
jgi:hypothetical protein